MKNEVHQAGDIPAKMFRNAWLWVPTLYLFQGIPYAIVQTTSGVIYTTMGVSIASLAFWTSLLYLPWTLKFLWSPYVEVVSTKRTWIVITQLLLGIAFVIIGLVMTLPFFYLVSLVLFAIAAFLSASHDIAADGFYMHALDQHKQTFFVGIRSTFYRIAMLTAMGLIPLVAGIVLEKTGLDPKVINVSAVEDKNKEDSQSGPDFSNINKSMDLVIGADNMFIALPTDGKEKGDSALLSIHLSSPPPAGEKIIMNLSYKSGSKDIKPDKKGSRYEFTSENWNIPHAVKFTLDKNLLKPAKAEFKITAGNTAFSWTVALVILGIFLAVLGIYHKFILPYPAEIKKDDQVSLRVYGEVFLSFFKKPGVVPALLFLFLYRLGEAQSIKIASPFLVDSRANGGIGLTSAQYGIAYGTIGMISLTIGGILGGFCAAKWGLKKLIWIMALSMNLPNLGLLYVSYIQPLPGDILVYAAIVLEQFGYGFGFTAYMLFMLYYVGDSKYKTAEYAIGTSIMAFGMMLPGMISGYIQEWLGYQYFFVYVMLCTIPGMLLIPFLKINREFGIKKKLNEN